MDWPGYDEPVIINANGRPGRIRPRINSEHQNPPQQYYNVNGQLLVPADSVRPHRSASVSGGKRPAQINIYNENMAFEDDRHHHDYDHRPRSSHRHSSSRHEDAHYSSHSRSRSHSRVRVRDPSPAMAAVGPSTAQYEYDFEMREKLRKLDLLERREEEEKRRRLQELEAIRAREEEAKRRHQIEVEEIARKEEEERRRKHIEEEIRLEAAEKLAKLEKQKKHDEELRKIAIAEYEAEKAHKAEKKKKEEEEEERIAKEKMRKMLYANGYTEDQIEKMINRAEHPAAYHDQQHQQPLYGALPPVPPPPPHHHHHHPGSPGNQIVAIAEHSSHNALAIPRPTYIKVHKKHLDPETLDAYDLPWEWDERDTSYIIIKRWIPEHDQDVLFEDTRRRRETKQITYTTTELKKERDQLLLVRKKEPVRKKSPARRSWILT